MLIHTIVTAEGILLFYHHHLIIIFPVHTPPDWGKVQSKVLKPMRALTRICSSKVSVSAAGGNRSHVPSRMPWTLWDFQAVILSTALVGLKAAIFWDSGTRRLWLWQRASKPIAGDSEGLCWYYYTVKIIQLRDIQNKQKTNKKLCYCSNLYNSIKHSRPNVWASCNLIMESHQSELKSAFQNSEQPRGSQVRLIQFS